MQIAEFKAGNLRSHKSPHADDARSQWDGVNWYVNQLIKQEDRLIMPQ